MFCGCGMKPQLCTSLLQPPKKKDNLSKDMKARLRKEYVGLGGAENSVGGQQWQMCAWVLQGRCLV